MKVSTTTLPNEMIFEIISHLTSEQKLAIARISKIWAFLVMAQPDAMFLKDIFNNMDLYKKKIAEFCSYEKTWYHSVHLSLNINNIYLSTFLPQSQSTSSVVSKSPDKLPNFMIGLKVNLADKNKKWAKNSMFYTPISRYCINYSLRTGKYTNLQCIIQNAVNCPNLEKISKTFDDIVIPYFNKVIEGINEKQKNQFEKMCQKMIQDEL